MDHPVETNLAYQRPPSASLSDTGGLPFEVQENVGILAGTGEEGGPHAAHASSLGQPGGQLSVGVRETHNGGSSSWVGGSLTSRR